MATITWATGGAASWVQFCNMLRNEVNFLPGGPKVRTSRTGGRNPVGTITVDDVHLTIRPGHSLVIVDRMRPADWWVK